MKSSLDRNSYAPLHARIQRRLRQVVNSRPRAALAPNMLGGKEAHHSAGLHQAHLACCLAAVMLAGQVSATSQVRRAETRRQTSVNTRTTPSEPTREVLKATSLGGEALPYRVLVPADYERSARRYPVLYLLHGRTGDENDWWTRTNLSLYATRYHLIIVTPGVGDSWYANSAADPRARYEDAITRDLIPHIDARYRTLANWHGRAIAGLSMGGLGAIKFALRYPHLFAFAASFSGAFDVPRTDGLDETDERARDIRRIYGPRDSATRRENDPFLLLERLAPEPARLPYLYVATGAGDPLPQVLLSNPRFADALRERKIAYEYHERPGAHDWLFWDAEIKFALERMSELMPQMRH